MWEANGKFDRLVNVAAMGRGARTAIMKMSALLAVLAAAGAWVWGHLR